MSTHAQKTTLSLTVPQVALLRQIVFRDLTGLAGRLQDDASEAAQGLSNVAGGDAEGTYATSMSATAELLDVLGWSTVGDGEMIVRAEREKRARREQEARHPHEPDEGGRDAPDSDANAGSE